MEGVSHSLTHSSCVLWCRRLFFLSLFRVLLGLVWIVTVFLYTRFFFFSVSLSLSLFLSVCLRVFGLVDGFLLSVFFFSARVRLIDHTRLFFPFFFAPLRNGPGALGAVVVYMYQ